MALLDTVIRELEQRFGLGERSSAFVADTIRYIIDTDHRQLRGFIDLFKKAGFGDLATSWVTKVPESLPLTGDQLEGALGSDLIKRFASRFSLADSTAREALAYTIPKLVSLLTPAGYIQYTLGGEVESFLDSTTVGPPPIAATLAAGAIRAAAVTPAAAATPAVSGMQAAAVTPPPPAPRSAPARDSRGVPVWGWLVALVWAGLLGYWAYNGPEWAHRPRVAAEPPQELPQVRPGPGQ